MLAMYSMPPPTEVVRMAPMGWHTTDISVLLKVKDLTVYNNIFWDFQVRRFYIIVQIRSAESKDIRVSREMVRRAVPHREIHIVIGSVPSSRPYDALYSVHSETSKGTVRPFVLVKGFVGLFSVGLGVLEEIQEDGAVFGVAQG